jgi:hypothetical protein
MPQRAKTAATNNGGGQTTTAPKIVAPSNPPQGGGVQALETLTHNAGIYLAMHEKVKEYEAEKEKAGVTLKKVIAEHPELLEQNGEHRETTVLFSGMIEILVRMQKAVSAKTTDDAIQVLRNKLGANLDKYIIVREELVDGALEALYNGGYITRQDVEDLTVVTSRESLIVKEAKSSKATPRKKSRP